MPTSISSISKEEKLEVAEDAAVGGRRTFKPFWVTARQRRSSEKRINAKKKKG